MRNYVIVMVAAKKLFLILLVFASAAITDDAHARNPLRYIYNTTDEKVLTTCYQLNDLMRNDWRDSIRPPTRPDNPNYRVGTWETLIYADRVSLASALLLYHICFYDQKATEIRILDMSSGRPVARSTLKNRYEPLNE